MTWPCEHPNFVYDAEHGWWGKCTECFRTAWNHEQAQPMEDIRRYIQALADGTSEDEAQRVPPFMKP